MQLPQHYTCKTKQHFPYTIVPAHMNEDIQSLTVELNGLVFKQLLFRILGTISSEFPLSVFLQA